MAGNREGRDMTVNTLPAARLMVSGLLQPDGAPEAREARRGMAVLDATGDAAGTLAGVVIDGATGRPTHLVLCRDTAAGDYRLVAVEQVVGLDTATCRLRLTAADVAALPRHNPD
jgi:hypothetical protein